MEKIWYDSNREADDKMPSTLGVKLSNGLTLLVLIVLVTGPVWNFIPWSLTPRGTLLGGVRLVIGVFLCHVGLIFWPCAALLIWSLLRHFFVKSMFRQRLWTVWIKLAVLAAVCLWQAWDCTQGVIWFWPWLYNRLAHYFTG